MENVDNFNWINMYVPADGTTHQGYVKDVKLITQSGSGVEKITHINRKEEAYSLLQSTWWKKRHEVTNQNTYREACIAKVAFWANDEKDEAVPMAELDLDLLNDNEFEWSFCDERTMTQIRQINLRRQEAASELRSSLSAIFSDVVRIPSAPSILACPSLVVGDNIDMSSVDVALAPPVASSSLSSVSTSVGSTTVEVALPDTAATALHPDNIPIIIQQEAFSTTALDPIPHSTLEEPMERGGNVIAQPSPTAAVEAGEEGSPQSQTSPPLASFPIVVAPLKRRSGVEQLHPITDELLRVYPNLTAASNFMAVAAGSISSCLNGNKERSNGFKWRNYFGPQIDFDAIEQLQAPLSVLQDIQRVFGGRPRLFPYEDVEITYKSRLPAVYPVKQQNTTTHADALSSAGDLQSSSSSSSSLSAESVRNVPTVSTVHTEEQPCVICLDVVAYTFIDGTDEIIFCDKCDLAVHQDCYVVKEIPAGEWYCRPCEAGLNWHTLKCELCNEIGGAYSQSTENGKWVHNICYMWMAEIKYTTLEPIRVIMADLKTERFSWKCFICNSSGNAACVQCDICHLSVHPQCVRKYRDLQGCKFDWENYTFYCGKCKGTKGRTAGHKRKRKALADPLLAASTAAGTDSIIGNVGDSSVATADRNAVQQIDEQIPATEAASLMLKRKNLYDNRTIAQADALAVSSATHNTDSTIERTAVNVDMDIIQPSDVLLNVTAAPVPTVADNVVATNTSSRQQNEESTNAHKHENSKPFRNTQSLAWIVELPHLCDVYAEFVANKKHLQYRQERLERADSMFRARKDSELLTAGEDTRFRELHRTTTDSSASSASSSSTDSSDSSASSYSTTAAAWGSRAEDDEIRQANPVSNNSEGRSSKGGSSDASTATAASVASAATLSIDTERYLLGVVNYLSTKKHHSEDLGSLGSILKRPANLKKSLRSLLESDPQRRFVVKVNRVPSRSHSVQLRAVCKHFHIGRCKNGADCTFLHISNTEGALKSSPYEPNSSTSYYEPNSSSSYFEPNSSSSYYEPNSSSSYYEPYSSSSYYEPNSSSVASHFCEQESSTSIGATAAATASSVSGARLSGGYINRLNDSHQLGIEKKGAGKRDAAGGSRPSSSNEKILSDYMEAVQNLLESENLGELGIPLSILGQKVQRPIQLMGNLSKTLKGDKASRFDVRKDADGLMRVFLVPKSKKISSQASHQHPSLPSSVPQRSPSCSSSITIVDRSSSSSLCQLQRLPPPPRASLQDITQDIRVGRDGRGGDQEEGDGESGNFSTMRNENG